MKTELREPLSILRDLIKKSGSLRKAAKSLNISAPYLSDIMKGRRDISKNVAVKLGMERVTTFEKSK